MFCVHFVVKRRCYKTTCGETSLVTFKNEASGQPKQTKCVFSTFLIGQLQAPARLNQGCQIFLGPNIPKQEKYTQ
jgi:hypothetical protein